MKRFLPTILLCFLASTMYCQQDELLKAIGDSLNNIQTLDYATTIWSKKMSSEVFEKRKFHIYAKRNPLNKGYNFDWEIIEGEGLNRFRHYLFTGSNFYSIGKDKKTLYHRSIDGKIPYGEFFETMRRFNLFDEILFDFNTIHENQEVVLQSDNPEHFQFTIKYGAREERHILFKKSHLFPDSLRTEYTDTELNLKQIFGVNIHNLKINSPLPDSVLNPQYYIDKGFTVKTSQDKKDEKPAIQNIELTDEQIDLLFQTPLVKSTGDSIKLSEIDAELILLDFWFMSCTPCRRGFPNMQKLSDTFKSKGLEVIGINFHDIDKKENVVGKLRESGILFSKFFSDRNLQAQIGVTYFPTFMVFDKNRKLVYAGAGNVDFHALVERILSKE